MKTVKRSFSNPWNFANSAEILSHQTMSMDSASWAVNRNLNGFIKKGKWKTMVKGAISADRQKHQKSHYLSMKLIMTSVHLRAFFTWKFHAAFSQVRKLFYKEKKNSSSFKLCFDQSFPDQCTICQMYFVRNEGSFMLRYNRKINAFCSQSCLAHYMYKYRFLEMCTICRRRKSNFNMLKSIDDDMTIRFNYCSMQCMQMVDQSTQLENVFFK